MYWFQSWKRKNALQLYFLILSSKLVAPTQTTLKTSWKAQGASTTSIGGQIRNLKWSEPRRQAERLNTFEELCVCVLWWSGPKGVFPSFTQWLLG